MCTYRETDRHAEANRHIWHCKRRHRCHECWQLIYLFLSFFLLSTVASFHYSFFPCFSYLLLSLFQSFTLYLHLHFDDEPRNGTNRIRTTVQLVSCHRVTRSAVTQYLLSQITWPCTHVSALDNKSNAYKEGRPSVRACVRHEYSRFRPFSLRTKFFVYTYRR